MQAAAGGDGPGVGDLAFNEKKKKDPEALKIKQMKKRIAEYLEKYSWTVPLVETEDHRVFHWLCGMQNN